MSVQRVKTKIKKILLERRVAQIEALNRFYAVLAFNYFRNEQPPNIGRRGRFWDNQTGQAALRVFTKAFREGYEFGWLIAHGIEYGIYLELANDRQNAALAPIIRRFSGRYFSDIKRLYSD